MSDRTMFLGEPPGGELKDAAYPALADWARLVVRDPNATTEADVERLRELGLGDREIFEAAALVALRLAFSTVNDALGVAPDRELAERVPGPVRDAVTYGRPPSKTRSRK